MSVRCLTGRSRQMTMAWLTRSIATNQKVPSVTIKAVKGTEVSEVKTDDFFKGKTVLIGLPAAYSPTCSEKQLPQFIESASAFRGKGVDKIAVLAVNDFFTLKAWGKDLKAGEAVTFLADGNGDLTKALDLELDLKKAGLGVRSKRFSAVVVDGVVKALNVEPDGTGYTVSGPDKLLTQV